MVYLILNMKLINNTKYPRKMLGDICKFALPKDLKRTPFLIEFNWRKDWRGVSGCFYLSKPMRITVMLPKDKRSYPYKWVPWKAIKNKGYLPNIIMDFEDEVVHVVAHEMRHMRQYVNGRIHKVFGSVGRFSERDADAYAIKKQREWRKLQVSVITLDPQMPECDIYFSNKHQRHKLEVTN